MPVADTACDVVVAESEEPLMNELPFPPLRKAHVLNCSFHSWHQKYRRITPKARCIPLTQPFVDYLRADGIVLPPDTQDQSSTDNEAFDSSRWRDPSDYDSDTEPTNNTDPSATWSELHTTITQTIHDLGGHVAPKLNWSAPRDATWINPTNTMNCPTANDIYLLLKSSDFVTHDLEHAFDGCIDSNAGPDALNEIPYHLVLRKWIPGLHPSLEFRCYVRQKNLLALCQRDLNYYDFLPALKPHLLHLVKAFFEQELRHTFPDPDYVFDVYVPPGADGKYPRVWLVDVNPWAVRTDPILFSWAELLAMEAPTVVEADDEMGGEDEVVRVPFRPSPDEDMLALNGLHLNGDNTTPASLSNSESDPTNPPASDFDTDSEHLAAPPRRPLELRLISRNDPESHAFSTPQYSAHKLPRDVVDASSAAAAGDLDGVRDFAEEWRRLVSRRAEHARNGITEETESSSDDDESVR